MNHNAVYQNPVITALSSRIFRSTSRLLPALLLLAWPALADPLKAFQDIPVPSFTAQAEYIPDNNTAWYTRWKLISEARKSISVAVFIIKPDIFGRSFLGLLLKKAEEGIRIQLLIDSKGSSGFSFTGKDYLQELLTHPNVEVRVYNPLTKAIFTHPGSLSYLMAGLHHKLLIVDDSYAMTGGRNVAPEYFADPADLPTAWRDSDILISGPSIADYWRPGFDIEFEQARIGKLKKDLFGNLDSKRDKLLYAAAAMDRWLNGQGEPPLSPERAAWLEGEKERQWWQEHGGADAAASMGPNPEPDSPDMYNEELARYATMVKLETFTPLAQPLEAEIKVLDKSSYAFQDAANRITGHLIELIDATEHELFIQNPYIVLSKPMFDALHRAHDRGVAITIHTNSAASTDSIYTQAFFIHDWKEFRKNLPRARIFVVSGKTSLHSKVFVFDRRISIVGTYNLDSISERINSEVVALTQSPALAERIMETLDQDISRSIDLGTVSEQDGPAPASFVHGFKRFMINFFQKLGFLRKYT